ncbi:hypothetical protein AB4072_08460 [Microvirga sp. 2MCAF38]|uniref:hypothetical protein n=1 Tax=Microvirga sp. 2MCAF38 TaxID=3232989 RepID=UPI003F9D0ACF
MTKIAAEFQISDVGLAKVCERHRVPTPPQGYWAKVEAGKKVKKALFVEVKDPELDRIDINGNLAQLPEGVRELAARHKAERLERRAVERKVFIPPIELAPPKSGEIHPAIRLTAKTLRNRSAQRDEVAQAFGDGLCGIEVGIQSVERVIVALDSLAQTLAERGLQIEPTGNGMRIANGAERAEFSLKEITRSVPHEPTEAELAEEVRRQKRRERYWRGEIPWSNYSFQEKAYPEKDTLRTGQLFLQIEGYGDGVRRKWADGKTQTIETLIPSIVDGFEILIAARKAERERREERDRRWQEYCRRRDLAKARQKREADRGPFVDRIIEIHREITRLQAWLAESRPIAEQRPDSSYRRMVEWVEERLNVLIISVEPAGIEKQLAESKLFPNPNADELHDPLGDPGERNYWQFS